MPTPKGGREHITIRPGDVKKLDASKPADKPPANAGTTPAGTAGAPLAAASTPAATSEEARKRNFLSPQKALAIAIAGLVAILNGEKVNALLSDEQKAQVKSAAAMADELNSQTIKPVQDRLKVVQTELAALTADPAKLADPAVITKVKDFANELSRLQKRLETFTGAATQTV